MDPEVVAQLLGRRDNRGPLSELTPREREVLTLMAEGRSNTGIGAELGISSSAIEKHVKQIFAKLDLPPAERGPPARPGGARLPGELTRAPGGGALGSALAVAAADVNAAWSGTSQRPGAAYGPLEPLYFPGVSS